MKGHKAMGNTVIYGAGTYGRRVLECLKLLDKDSVDMFLVTKKHDEHFIENIPVYELPEVDEDTLAHYNIIVAVDERFHSDIKKAINERFHNKIIDNFIFYKKSDLDKLYRDTHPFDTDVFLSTIEPVSRLFGNERGTPIDRLYIERFLELQSRKLKNCKYILEVGEDIYSKRFFPDGKHDILDYSKGMDLTKEDTLPENKYDVFVCTQVFHQIYDVRSAIKGAYCLLKPGGVMLATVCGNISKLARNDEYDHYWGFTRISIEMLVKEAFGNDVEVESYGNIAVANAFIQGVSVEEMDSNLFDIQDEDFTICISVVARKK